MMYIALKVECYECETSYDLAGPQLVTILGTDHFIVTLMLRLKNEVEPKSWTWTQLPSPAAGDPDTLVAIYDRHPGTYEIHRLP